jgi:ribosomal-protein-alanine N-acetyltransferase
MPSLHSFAQLLIYGMQDSYKTSRLVLNKLTLDDAEFISELVNSQGWIQFIGDRNVRSREQAEDYVRKIKNNPAITYWVVKIKKSGVRIGIITFIKRADLDYPDIGFAFLSRFSKQGYALEATEVVLQDAGKEHASILAITMKENSSSIRLLEKLGFRFDREIIKEGETLHVYLSTFHK